MGFERVNQWLGLLYGLVLVFFRHSVYEDQGYLASVRDLIPLLAIVAADTDQQAILGFESRYPLPINLHCL